MEFSQFCRACACEVNESCKIENNPAKPELPLLLKRYVPEFDIKVENACLCFACLSTLYNFHNFKRKCLRTEEDLRLHLRRYPDVKTVDLKEIFAPRETIETASGTVTTATPSVAKQVISRRFLESKKSPQMYNRKFRGRKRYQCEKCNRGFDKKNKWYYEHVAYHKKPEAGRFMCKICYFVYQSSGALSEHNFRNHLSDDQKPFNCKVCAKRFVKKVSLVRHMVTHTEGKLYKCSKEATIKSSQAKTVRSVCDRVFQTKKALQKHIRIFHRRERYQCDQCSRIFVLKKAYDIHLAYHKKPKANRYVCKECNFVYKSFGGLNKHKFSKHSTDDQKPFQCEVCTKRFPERSVLTKHMRTHTGEKPIKRSKSTCEICNRSFFTAKSLQIHQEKHRRRERYQCDQCSRDFVLRKAYDMHLAYHKGRNADRFVCKDCNFVYQSSSGLNKHNFSKHSTDEQKPFQCEVCTKKFAERCVLRKHMRTHTGEKPIKKPKVTCEICHRSFFSAKSLQIHQEKHHTRKHYQCDQCSRDFISKNLYDVHLAYHKTPNADRFICKTCNFVYQSFSALNKHTINKHSGDDQKPFQCEVCEKRFAQKATLTIHLRTHTGEKPYKCSMCKYASGQRYALYKHVSGKHNVEVERKFVKGNSVVKQDI